MKRFSILGAGNIAATMADTVAQMPGIAPYAVASRDEGRARTFAQKHGFERAYGSYEAMLADPEVSLVYIATPHSHHHAHMLLCLKAGKHVLCEKAFTVNAGQAREVLSLAARKGLYVGEAIWTRYMPLAPEIRALCEDGRLGRVTGLTANLGYPVFHHPRLREPALAGGALLDIGVYPLTFASVAFGDDIAQVEASAVMSDTGVDMQNTVTLHYPDGRMASIMSSAISATDRRGVIYGDRGYAVIDHVNNLQSIRLYGLDHQLTGQIDRPHRVNGYEYQIEEAFAAMAEGRIQCPQMPHSRIIATMALMDRIRAIWGMKYPGE